MINADVLQLFAALSALVLFGLVLTLPRLKASPSLCHELPLTQTMVSFGGTHLNVWSVNQVAPTTGNSSSATPDLNVVFSAKRE